CSSDLLGETGTLRVERPVWDSRLGFILWSHMSVHYKSGSLFLSLSLSPSLSLCLSLSLSLFAFLFFPCTPHPLFFSLSLSLVHMPVCTNLYPCLSVEPAGTTLLSFSLF